MARLSSRWPMHSGLWNWEPQFPRKHKLQEYSKRKSRKTIQLEKTVFGRVYSADDNLVG
jgi:hypothetical protein